MMIQEAYRTPNIFMLLGSSSNCCIGAQQTLMQKQEEKLLSAATFETSPQAALHHPMSQSLLDFKLSTGKQFSKFKFLIFAYYQPAT
jgi:hypothetical protein